jgi:hypothetical protein
MPEARPRERMHCRHARVSMCDGGPARAQLTRVLLGVDLLAASNGTQLVDELRRHGAALRPSSRHDAPHWTRSLALLSGLGDAARPLQPWPPCGDGPHRARTL